MPDGTLRNDDDPTNADTPLLFIALVTGVLLINELVNGVVFNVDVFNGDTTGDVTIFFEMLSSTASSIFATLASIASS